MYKNMFLPLAEYLVKSKGRCNLSAATNCKIKNCPMCYYKEVIKSGTPCMTYEVYEFALKFVKENKDKQLELEF